MVCCNIIIFNSYNDKCVPNFYSPVELGLNNGKINIEWQGISLDEKFSEYFDGKPCHLLFVEQKRVLVKNIE